MDRNTLGAVRGVALTFCIWLHITRRKTGLTCKTWMRNSLRGWTENNTSRQRNCCEANIHSVRKLHFKIATEGLRVEFDFSAPEKILKLSGLTLVKDNCRPSRWKTLEMISFDICTVAIISNSKHAQIWSSLPLPSYYECCSNACFTSEKSHYLHQY